VTRALSAGLRRPWFDRVRLSPLPYSGSERCSCRRSSARVGSAAVRQRAGDHSPRASRCNFKLWVRIFAQNRTEERAIAGPRAFNGLCDDEGVPLICPTCQVFAQSASVPATACYLAWGRFRYFCLGATAAWRFLQSMQAILGFFADGVCDLRRKPGLPSWYETRRDARLVVLLLVGADGFSLFARR